MCASVYKIHCFVTPEKKKDLSGCLYLSDENKGIEDKISQISAWTEFRGLHATK